MCLHNDWLDPATCSICIHGPEITRAKKPRPEPKPKPKVSAFQHRIDLYASGEWCALCETPFHRGLCQCRREARLELNSDVVKEWGRQAAELQAKPRNQQGVRLLAHGALGLEITRAGTGDRIMPEFEGQFVTERQAAMTLDRMEAGVEPKWQPSNNTKADERGLPLPR